LVDVSAEMGPTEYMSGTHTDCSTSELEMLRKSGLFSLATFLRNCGTSVTAVLWSLATAPLASLRKGLGRFVQLPKDGRCKWLPRLQWYEVQYALYSLPYELMALGATCDRVCDPSTTGAVIIHDYRIYHRGTQNHSTHIRPVLYFTFSAEGYDDSGNYTGQVGCVEEERLRRASKKTRSLLRNWETREAGTLAGKPGLFFGYC